MKAPPGGEVDLADYVMVVARLVLRGGWIQCGFCLMPVFVQATHVSVSHFFFSNINFSRIDRFNLGQ